MAQVLRKAALWLGFIRDDILDEDDENLYSERIYPSVDADPAPTKVTSLDTRQELSLVPDNSPKIGDYVTLRPTCYPEAKAIGENFRSGIPVVMVVSQMQTDDARRLVDFSAGLTFALHGKIERVTKGVFLLTPKGVTVTADDKEKIKSGLVD